MAALPRRWRKKLETVVNVVVIIAAVLLIYAVVTKVLLRPAEDELFAGDITRVRAGDSLPALPDFSWNDSDYTLLVALSPQCRYCTESMPFYRRLFSEVRAGNIHLRVAALFASSTPVQIADTYLKDSALEVDRVVFASLDPLGIGGTPTLVLADRDGKVMNVWSGKTKSEEEKELRSQLMALKADDCCR